VTISGPEVWTVCASDTLATTALAMVAERAGLRAGGRLDPDRLDERRCRRGDLVAVDPLDGSDPLQFAAMLVDRLPEVRLVALTHRRDDWFVLQVLRLGFTGYLLTSTPAEELVLALQALADGRPALSSTLAASLAVDAARLSESEFWPGMGRGLTRRESEVLRGLSRGCSTRGLADELFLGEETVRSHLKTLYQKLGVSDRAAAVAHAYRCGILSADGPERG
jgi:DNA-binding NarL/FixJ family response regulator